MSGHRGIALILVVLVTSFLSAIGLGLALVIFMDQLATGNMRGSVAMLYAADAGIELAAHEFAVVADWDHALSGLEPAAFADGAAGGSRPIPGGGTVDLTAATNRLNCGRPSACTPAQMDAATRERPWGANNPRWRLYAWGPLDRIGPIARPAPCYLAVWIGDDGREQDDDPLTDSADADAPGHGILRVRAEAYGPRSSRRVVEAELARVCLPDGAPPGACRAGIRVQSWQELRLAVP